MQGVRRSGRRSLGIALLSAFASLVSSAAAQEANAPPLTAEQLAGKSFRFSWKQGESGGFNGIATLQADGRIGGIGSSNEHSWAIDDEGRLIFKHSDGRVSSVYDQLGREAGRLHFSGRFLFREGILHLLDEVPREFGRDMPERLSISAQRFVCLDPGDEYLYVLEDGSQRRLRLISVAEQRDSVVGLIRRAAIELAVDGEVHDLVCAPYVMPTTIRGMRICADTTSGFAKLPKRVQFSVWDASDPIVDPERFGFPLRDFRLFSHGLQCTNEPVHLGRKDGDPGTGFFYHNYGIDFAGYEGAERVLSCTDGVVVRLHPVGEPWSIAIEDELGLIWEYMHMDSLAEGLSPGTKVTKGQELGILGRTGPSGNFAHLHVGTYSSRAHLEANRNNRRMNLYPLMVAAYRNAASPVLQAVAGRHHQALTSETVTFDAAGSLAGNAPIESHRWIFHDGQIVDGPLATKVYAAPGAYVAELRVRDARGREDVDFCKVKVYTRGAPEPYLPTIFMTHTPAAGVVVGQPVRFRMWLHAAEDQPMRIDFGDGEVVEGYESFTVVEHAFEQPGLHVVTATAEVVGLPITAKQALHVQRERPAAPLGRDGSLPTRRAVSRAALERDWMLQDYMAADLPPELEAEKERWRAEYLNENASRDEPAVLARLHCFESDDDAEVEQRMIARVLADLAPADAATLGTACERLAALGLPGNDLAWRALYLRSCELRRTQSLAPLLARWTRFVFNEHPHIPGSWKYTEGLSDAQSSRVFLPGSALSILEMDGSHGRVRTLIEDPGGVIRNPDVSWDGSRVLFAWKKSDREDDYHLYEFARDGGQITQLTHGLGWADYEGAYLPDGNIVFSSTRCMQTVDCNWVEVSNLYLMDGAGRYMRRVGFDQVHTIFPTATWDGRILYTRWEYNDRAQVYPQPLFEMNLDGTNQREFYGNSSWFPTNIIHARHIADTREVLAIVTGHHTPAHGKLARIDPARGRQEAEGVRFYAPERTPEAERIDVYGQRGMQFQFPYPLDGERFLVSLALPTPQGKLGRFDLYFMDRAGRRELLVEGREAGEGCGCRQIVPLAPRPPVHVRPHVVDYTQASGTLYMQDIHEGLALRGVPRGTVKRLRVIALEYRAAGVGHCKQEGRGGGADVSTPVAIGNGSWDVKVVLGSTAVQADGSACFEVPASTPIYFQALDERGYAVQTMRSWTTLMPGEVQSCVGCHEEKNTTPLAARGVTLAMRSGARPLQPFNGPTRGFSFLRDVQPILDRHCASCHDGREDVPYDLHGELVHESEMKRMLARSYLELTHTKGIIGDKDHSLVNWIDSMSEPELLPPYHRGAARSRLMELIEQGHGEAQLSYAERETIACWIDLLVPYCGDYLEAHAWSQREIDFYTGFLDKRRRMEARERENIRALIESRAASSGE